MLCGYLKQTCKSITVKELIEILKLCKNPDAIIKMSEMTNFFIHFDQDGQFIDFSKSPMTNQYGEPGTNCNNCGRFDRREKVCRCDGNNCINAEAMIDTEKLNELRSSKIETPQPTISQAPTKHFQNNNYDLSNYGINGNSFVEQQQQPQQVRQYNDVNNNTPVVQEKKEEKQIGSTDIQAAIDKAIVNALNKMINGIKGE